MSKNIKNIDEFLLEKEQCICIKSVKFKNGMNYFIDFEYNCDISLDSASVSYKDGRTTKMSRVIFDSHFETTKIHTSKEFNL